MGGQIWFPPRLLELWRVVWMDQRSWEPLFKIKPQDLHNSYLLAFGSKFWCFSRHFLCLIWNYFNYTANFNYMLHILLNIFCVVTFTRSWRSQWRSIMNSVKNFAWPNENQVQIVESESMEAVASYRVWSLFMLELHLPRRKVLVIQHTIVVVVIIINKPTMFS